MTRPAPKNTGSRDNEWDNDDTDNEYRGGGCGDDGAGNLRRGWRRWWRHLFFLKQSQILPKKGQQFMETEFNGCGQQCLRHRGSSGIRYLESLRHRDVWEHSIRYRALLITGHTENSDLFNAVRQFPTPLPRFLSCV